MRIYTCSICKKSFNNKEKAYRHLDYEHEEKLVYVCQLCLKTFRTKEQGSKHLQYKHMDEIAEAERIEANEVLRAYVNSIGVCKTVEEV